jgi:hypothetical protein
MRPTTYRWHLTKIREKAKTAPRELLS